MEIRGVLTWGCSQHNHPSWLHNEEIPPGQWEGLSLVGGECKKFYMQGWFFSSWGPTHWGAETKKIPTFEFLTREIHESQSMMTLHCKCWANLSHSHTNRRYLLHGDAAVKAKPNMAVFWVPDVRPKLEKPSDYQWKHEGHHKMCHLRLKGK